MGAIIVGCMQSLPIQNALKKLNIQPIRWWAGRNVAILPAAISRDVGVVIIFEDFRSQELSDGVCRIAERLSIPVLRCRPSVSALAAAWSTAFRDTAMS